MIGWMWRSTIHFPWFLVHTPAFPILFQECSLFWSLSAYETIFYLLMFHSHLIGQRPRQISCCTKWNILSCIPPNLLASQLAIQEKYCARCPYIPTWHFNGCHQENVHCTGHKAKATYKHQFRHSKAHVYAAGHRPNLSTWMRLTGGSHKAKLVMWW